MTLNYTQIKKTRVLLYKEQLGNVLPLIQPIKSVVNI